MKSIFRSVAIILVCVHLNSLVRAVCDNEKVRCGEEKTEMGRLPYCARTSGGRLFTLLLQQKWSQAHH